MNELVQIVQQKSGLSEAQSVEIVKAVVEFVKTKLPAGLASHVDGLEAVRSNQGCRQRRNLTPRRRRQSTVRAGLPSTARGEVPSPGRQSGQAEERAAAFCNG